MFDLDRLATLARGAQPAALCTVTATSGSTPRKAGAAMVVIADGSEAGAIEGTIGGGAIEHQIRAAALEHIALCRPGQVEFSLTTQLGMCCGGRMTLFIEPLRQRPPFIIFGAGHVGQALAASAAVAGFDVHVADPREELLDAGRLPGATLHDAYDEEDFDDLPFGPDAFVIVVTHDHAVDQQLVERALGRDTRYLAMIGSERKARLMRDRAIAKGFDEAKVAAVRSPAGLDIGAETPEEIAISIVAEMVQVRRQEAPGAPAEAVVAQKAS
jgi:xanthine dehydrogenase accessory factor